MTANERTRVLEMVAKGTISIEQADQLLEALENTKTNHATQNDSPEIPASDDEESQKGFGQNWTRLGKDWGRFGQEFGRGFRSPASPRPPHPPRPPRPPRAPKGVGGGKLSFEQMIELGQYGISANYVRELSEAGLNDLSFEEVIKLGQYGINAKYVIELRKLGDELGAGELTLDRIIELGQYGVRPENVREMIQSGLFDLSKITDRDVERVDRRRTKLEAKLARVHARLETTRGEHDERKLREIAQELQDELDELERIHLNIEIEGSDETHEELQADAPETNREEP
jgi:DNA-binding transcriptional MerR regulator